MEPHVRLYEHQPAALLPILESHLPASLFVYGSLVSPSSSTQPTPNVRVWSTIPALSDGTPIASSAQGTIIVALPPESGQIRVFDTAESAFRLPPTADDYFDARAPQGDERTGSEKDEWRDEQLAKEQGRMRVTGALRTYVTVIDPECKMVGGLHELWVKAVEDTLGDGVSRSGCGTWLPPQSSERANVRKGENCDEDGVRRNWPVEGYEVDIGRDCDNEAFSGGSDITRDSSYYASRLPWSTVIRPLPSPHPSSSTSAHPSSPLAAVCHVLTGPDGSLGTLSTHPSHRRKGLAGWIVNAHFDSGRGSFPTANGGRAYTVVFDRNTASRGMFTGLGWSRAWGCSWVGIGHGEEGEEARRRAKELEGIREGLRGSELAERNTLEGR